MPVACSTVFRQRVCHFPPCGAVFYLCAHCDRGQRYCRPHCRDKSRRLQRREANRRYEQSLGLDGRLDHRQRQREYRQRLKARVTDQSSLACFSLCESDGASGSATGRSPCGGRFFPGVGGRIRRQRGRLSDLRTPGALGQSFSRGGA